MTLFLNFKQTVETIFLDAKRDITVDLEKKYHIILSPSLYWVKREKLPLKYVHEVKKIVATLFEEILPKGEYSYFVDKDEEAFLLFAYDDKAILKLLESKGIRLSNVSGISFAQHSFADEQKPIQINKDEVIVSKDGIVVVLPSEWFKEKKVLEESKLYPSKQTIHLEKFSHIIDRKTLYTVGMLVLLFMSVLLGEYIYYSLELEKIRQQKEKVFTGSNLKPTLMQNRAILQKYQKLIKRQEKLRTVLAMILQANFKKAQRVDAIVYDGKKLQIVLEGVTQADLPKIFSKLYKAKINMQAKEKAKNLVLEVDL